MDRNNDRERRHHHSLLVAFTTATSSISIFDSALAVRFVSPKCSERVTYISYPKLTT